MHFGPPIITMQNKMLSLRHFAAVIAFALCSSFTLNALQTTPKREMRAVWVTPIAYCWPKAIKTTLANQKAEALAILNNMQASGLNAAFVHVRMYGDRIFTKTSCTINGQKLQDYEPTSKYVTKEGTRGGTIETDADGSDILDYWITEAHARGIEIYAWVNPYRTINPNGSEATKADKDAASWVIEHSYVSNGTTKYEYRYNPGLASTQARATNICRILTYNYDIDGIVFDDYFYQDNLPTGENAPDYSTYVDSKTTMAMDDWRRANINQNIKEIQAAIHEVKPWVVFGISPAGAAWKGLRESDGLPSMYGFTDSKTGLTCRPSDNNWVSLFCDPLHWMRNKTIDFISPQLYWRNDHATNAYAPMSAWWSMAAEKFDVPLFTSQDINTGAPQLFTDDAAGYNTSRTQLEQNRSNCLDNRPGEVFYSSKNIVGPNMTGFGTHLKGNVFKYPAAIPAMHGDRGTDPGLITGVSYSSNTLKWTAKTGMRYLVYAVPTSVNMVDATDPDQGGIRAEYLLSNWIQTNSYAIPSGKRSGYWYAVAPLDRFGNEWACTTYGNVPASLQAEVSLTSPAAGATASWSQTFTYSGTQGATFQFQLSENTGFTICPIDHASTATSYTVDFKNLTPGKTYYWRVKATKENHIEATSGTRTIIAPSLGTMQAVSLLTPAEGATVDYSPLFTWTNPDAATDFVLQISTSPEFTKIQYSATVKTPQATVDMYSLNRNTQYYWRVISKKECYNDATSQTRSFMSPSAPTLNAVQLCAPINNETVTSDFNFVIRSVGADSYLLEVATDPMFENVVFSSSSRWVLESTNRYYEYTVPLNLFPANQYYWRVTASKTGYADNVSDYQTFNTGEPTGEETYVPYRDPADYPTHDDITFTNLWVRDAAHNPLGINEGDSRDMVARADQDGDQDGRDIVYIVDKGNARLLRYDGNTGQDLAPLSLSFDASFNKTYAPNGVLVDANNNLLVYNLSLAGNNLTVGKVNTATGAVATMFKASNKYRIDHIDIVNGINDATYWIFGIGSPASGNNYVSKFKVVEGSITINNAMKLGNLGAAPRIKMITASYFYADGPDIPIHKYTYTKITTTTTTAADGTTTETESGPTSPIQKSSDFISRNNKGNGIHTFNHDGQDYFVIANGKCDGSTNADNWMLIQTSDNTTLEDLTHVRSFPEGGIGAAKRTSGVYSMPVSTIQRDAKAQLTRAPKAKAPSASTAKNTTIYTYSSNNGLAAYSMTARQITAVENVATEHTLQVSDYGNGQLRFSEDVTCQVYTLTGTLVAQAQGQSITVPRGFYVVKAQSLTQPKLTLTKKITVL